MGSKRDALQALIECAAQGRSVRVNLIVDYLLSLPATAPTPGEEDRLLQEAMRQAEGFTPDELAIVEFYPQAMMEELAKNR